jgi:hypothetical protein
MARVEQAEAAECSRGRQAVTNLFKSEKTLTFDLHPLYASILKDGATVREGEVLGLDQDLRRVMVAPFSGVIRLLTIGDGDGRRVKVFLTEPTNGRREFRSLVPAGIARN